MFTRTRFAGILVLALATLFVGCETASTTVIDAHTGKPLAYTRVKQSDGTVRYTGADGTVERTPGTTANVSRPGYRSVTTDL